MKVVDDRLRLSPVDVANHLACRHLTTLDLAVAEGRLERPVASQSLLEQLKERGRQHEAAYVQYLQSQGFGIVDLADQALTAEGMAAAREAMARGADVIVQAPLVQCGWAGRADILRRVDAPSDLGAWSYEAVDTKLARETRAGTILQLCEYSELVRSLQGRAPDAMHVVSPGQPFTEQTYRVGDFLAYYRLVRRQLEAAVSDRSGAVTYPDPVPHCDVCRWWQACDGRRRVDDHLSLVAGIRWMQIDELRRWGINTLEHFGTLSRPLPKPSRGSVESLTRAREQARVQLQGRIAGSPVYELLPLQEGHGLFRLAAPSDGDVFLDIEGDPFVGLSGHEYLFGLVARDGGIWSYRAWWALDPTGERDAFESVVDYLIHRWQQHPDLHVYHYASYEPAAMRRLMGKHGTREDEVDRLLRGGVFLDLYAVVRQALLAGVERYSIKNLEAFYAFTRSIPLREASQHLQAAEHLLELGHGTTIPIEVRDAVERYNRDDCFSALGLRDWLESLRSGCEAGGHPIPRPRPQSAEASEALSEREARVQALMERLMAEVPADATARSPTQHARWLLAQLLEFHRREDKATWWEFYRLAELSDEEKLDEPAALAGLEFVARVGGTTRCPVDRYRFPPQEFFVRLGSQAVLDQESRLGTLDAVDLDGRTVDIKKRSDVADLHPTTVFFHNRIDARPLSESLMRLGEWVAAHGMDEPGRYHAARDLLLLAPPRLAAGTAWHQPGEPIADRARRLAVALDGGALPVQGPPGSGKTHTAARMICALVREGKKIGVTATSHKVIRNLLDKLQDVSRSEGLAVRCIQKVPEASDEGDEAIRETESNDDVLSALEQGEADVAAGTAWLWARPEFLESVDVLFVDEAGQMSLADALAAAHAAHNVVLLGDPQQLEQPIQGSHPDGTAVSVLQHVLGSHETIPGDRGLFLEETWRLHPNLCAFTSETFYENRLRSRPGLERQRLHGPGQLQGAGLWFLPVPHEGNQNSSPDEVAAVGALVEELADGQYSWIDADGRARALGVDDILVVAPYNAQVYAIRDRVPGARVGTVDRFQGQEAPVVIYSLTTSSPEDAPRGMEFLYSLNRLNVATSRARGAVVLVASPRIFEPDCQTPRQMRLANAFCRYLELARSLSAPASSGLAAPDADPAPRIR
jgi:uncharacterized protein